MYRTMEGTHYNSPEKAIQVWFPLYLVQDIKVVLFATVFGSV